MRALRKMRARCYDDEKMMMKRVILKECAMFLCARRARCVYARWRPSAPFKHHCRRLHLTSMPPDFDACLLCLFDADVAVRPPPQKMRRYRKAGVYENSRERAMPAAASMSTRVDYVMARYVFAARFATLLVGAIRAVRLRAARRMLTPFRAFDVYCLPYADAVCR